MAQIPQVPPVPEVREVFSLIAFLNDKDAVADRLAKLEAMRADVNALIEVHGKAKEIDGLYYKADEALRDARVQLDRARLDAEAIKAAARAALEKERADNAAKRSVLDAREAALAERAAMLADGEAKLNDAQQVLADSLVKAGARESAAQKMMASALAIKKDYEERRAKLLDAVKEPVA